MKVTAIASPNHKPRPAGTVVDTIVVHNDESENAQRSISWIKAKKSGVSYHVLVDRDGSLYRFVEVARRAYHAGVSEYDGRAKVNDYSLGLCFANRNDGVEEYTDLQYQVGAAVVAGWMRVYPAITLDRITTHAEVARCNKGCLVDRKPPRTCEHYPEGRKRDPGPCFDMEKFRRYVEETLAGIEPGPRGRAA